MTFITRPFRVLGRVSHGDYGFEQIGSKRWLTSLAWFAVIALMLAIIASFINTVAAIVFLVLYVLLAGLTQHTHNQTRQRQSDENSQYGNEQHAPRHELGGIRG